MVSSAIVGETVNRIMSSMTGKDEEKSKKKENIERLEMAHIKLEAVLQVSDRWQITEVPLLRWRSKLKRAAQECDDTLLKCKQRALEDEETRQRVSKSSFPIRIAHATKSLISSFIGFSDDSSSCSANVRRFERYANGANEFLKTVECGGTPLRYTFFHPLIRHLFTGKSVRYQAFQEDKLFYISIRPISSAERGIEAMIGFACQDFKEPTKGFYVSCTLRLSESTDIFDVIIKCLKPVAPHFKFAVEGIRRGLIQLPIQDFTWDSPYGESEFWANVHNILTKWHRPNPLCCNGHEHRLIISSSTSNTRASSSRLLSNIFPEEVIHVQLKWHIPLSDQGTSSKILTAVYGGNITQSSDIPTVKIGVLVIPHESSEDIEPSADSYALEVIDGKEQGIIHTNANLQELGEKLLPKAVEHLHENSESEMYQLSLKSRHGTAHICLEKASIQIQSAAMVQREAARRAQDRSATLQQDIERWKVVSRDIMKLWVVRRSDKLQGLLMDTFNLA
ncbi:hypothetical protein HU200_027940 [Digitaria exilis]|uniref:Uncharacterized protein n=1 Tax=Digitaria exilis TaxID=1010633 RepID=A0A835EW00_9POAL|nr:hypothetical protein HU200_027940 [Digitaria exilis]